MQITRNVKNFHTLPSEGKKKHNFVNEFLIMTCLKIADKGEECVNDRNFFLNLRGLGASSEYCPAPR